MLTRAELKQQAKEQLKGNLGMLVLCGVIYFAISMVLSMIPYVGAIATLFVIPPIYLGLFIVLLNVTYGEKDTPLLSVFILCFRIIWAICSSYAWKGSDFGRLF